MGKLIDRAKPSQRGKIKKGSTRDLKREAQRAAFLKALAANEGLVYIAAAKCGCDPRVHYSALKDSPEYVEAYKAILERKLDDAEHQLSKAIRAGRDIPLMFYLKCKGKERGYVERQEVAAVTPDGVPVVPDSVVQNVLEKIMAAERARLAASEDTE